MMARLGQKSPWTRTGWKGGKDIKAGTIVGIAARVRCVRQLIIHRGLGRCFLTLFSSPSLSMPFLLLLLLLLLFWTECFFSLTQRSESKLGKKARSNATSAEMWRTSRVRWRPRERKSDR